MMVAARYRELRTTGSDGWLNSHRFGLSVYIILSLVFFSVSLSRGYYPPRLEIRSFATPSSSSALNALPSDARLAKLVALQPPPIHFDPLTYLPVIKPHSHEITACLWAPESRLDWVSAWTTEWPGPISLLVVTRKPQTSTHSPLYPELVKFLRHPMVNTSRLAIHMLHLDLATPEAPNVFINLARLFAPTSVVLLIPGTPPKPPPSTAISSFFKAQTRDPIIVRASEARPRTRVVADKRRHPVSSALTPVLIPRNHPLWCTERFAFVPAPVAVRAADWDVCLWQVQLETFGSANISSPALPGWQWDVEFESIEPALPSVTVVSAVRRRLEVRYRAETCMLTMKRLEVLSEEWRGGGYGRFGVRIGRKSAERMRWLHEMCREWS